MLTPTRGDAPPAPSVQPKHPTTRARGLVMPTSTPQPVPSQVSALLEHAAAKARAAGVFGEVTVKDGLLEAQALSSAEPAAYRISVDGGRLWVSLVTANRWLSQSIEQDLVHTGDKLDDLLHEELVDLGYTGKPVPFEHFRSEDKLFTFRSVVPVSLDVPGQAGADTAALFLLGYEACFRALGDMEADGED